MKNVIVREKEGKTEIEALPFKMLVRFDDENLEILFEGKQNNNIALRGDTKMVIDGDFFLGANGELQIASKDKDLHFDSIRSCIHLNSRRSSFLKDLPESEQYRRLKEEEYKKSQKKVEEQEKKIKEFHIYIESLEDRIKQLEEKNG